MNHWPISVNEALGVSVNLIALLGLDTVCLPNETAGKVTGTIIRKERKMIFMSIFSDFLKIFCYKILSRLF